VRAGGSTAALVGLRAANARRGRTERHSSQQRNRSRTVIGLPRGSRSSTPLLREGGAAFAERKATIRARERLPAARRACRTASGRGRIVFVGGSNLILSTVPSKSADPPLTKKELVRKCPTIRRRGVLRMTWSFQKTGNRAVLGAMAAPGPEAGWSQPASLPFDQDATTLVDSPARPSARLAKKNLLDFCRILTADFRPCGC
jgi:hypothetical protein